MNDTVTPVTAAVDAPASMESIIAEIAQDAPAPQEAADDVAKELVEEAEEGQPAEGEQPDEEAEAEGDATDADEEAEETTEDEPETDDEPEPTYKVKVNGEEVEVPLSELRKGYSRERDYTAKTMAMAEERKNLEARFANELKLHLETFEQLDPILSEAKNIDWQALSQSDPATYVQLKEAVDARQKAVTEARERLAQAEQATSDPERDAAIAQAETQALIEKARETGIADLSEPEKMGEFARNAVSYLRDTGYEDGEIAELTDHRALLIIEKARRFDKLDRAKKALPAKKIVPRSQVKNLRSGGDGSQAPKTRFPENAPRERQLDYIANQILAEQKG